MPSLALLVVDSDNLHGLEDLGSGHPLRVYGAPASHPGTHPSLHDLSGGQTDGLDVGHHGHPPVQLQQRHVESVRLRGLLVQRMTVNLGHGELLPGQRLAVLHQGVLPQDHDVANTEDAPQLLPDTVAGRHDPSVIKS